MGRFDLWVSRCLVDGSWVWFVWWVMVLSSKTNSYQVKLSKSNPIFICIWGVRLFLRKDKIISSLSTSLSIYNHQKWSLRSELSLIELTLLLLLLPPCSHNNALLQRLLFYSLLRSWVYSYRLFHRDLLIAESLCSMGSSPNLADEMGGFAM